MRDEQRPCSDTEDRRGRGELALALLAALCISLVTGFMLYQLRQDTWRAAVASAQNMANLISQDLERTVGSYDLSLQGAADALTLPGFKDLPLTLAGAAVFDRSIQGRLFGTMLVLDRDGNVTMNSSGREFPALNNSDRDYFIAQRDRTVEGLFVSQPYVSRISQEPVIALSRRVSNQDGSFAGVVAGNLRLTYLREQFSRLDIGKRSSVNVYRNDGILIMRQPYVEHNLGRNIQGSSTYRMMSAASSGVFTGRSSIDSVERLYAFQHLSSAPLFVDVAIGVDDLLAGWWEQALVISAIVLSLCVLIVSSTVRSGREIRRRLSVETSLQVAVRELERLSRTDALTGLSNRRHFDVILERELKRARLAGSDLSLMMIDADLFKTYNDRYGHQAGDYVLRRVAGCLMTNTRLADGLAFRIGGEEFALTLPGADKREACRIAADIQRSLETQAIQHETSVTGIVTVSIGIAYAGPGSSIGTAELFRIADLALYDAKSAGRNAIRAYDVQPSARLLSA